jgi:hypothetical protein
VNYRLLDLRDAIPVLDLTDTYVWSRMVFVEKRLSKLSEIARALVKERWKGTSAQERSDLARELSLTRWSKATEEDRQAARDRLAKARKKRWPKKKRSKSDEQKTG